MTPNVRIYDSEESARSAAAKLADAGFGTQRVLLASELAGQEAAAVRSAVRDGLLPGSQASFCTQNLAKGRSLVAVVAPFGYSLEALDIMESCGPVDVDKMPRHVPSRDPSPLSDALGFPTVVDFVPMTDLTSSSWSLSGVFGLPLLTKNQRGKARLSSPKRPWNSSMGLPVLTRNQRGKARLTTPKRPWNWSMGFPLLSNNPAPLSSLFGIPTLTKRR